MAKSIFACIGFVIMAEAMLGSFGIGNFVFYYGPDKVCTNLK
jgi:hypothetical protein